jgi:CheY-like chemotaxis protein
VSDLEITQDEFNAIQADARIRQRWGADLPALLFTGNISKETHTLARNAGLPVLFKPAKAVALREAITNALGGSKSYEERV